MTSLLAPEPPAQGDSTRVMKDVAHLREVLRSTPDQGAAEIERYLKSQGATPVEETPAEPSTSLFGAGFPTDSTRHSPTDDVEVVHSKVGGPDQTVNWTEFGKNIQDKSIGSITAGAGFEGLSGLASGAMGLAKKFPATAVGFLRGGIPGAAKALLSKDLLGQVLSRGAPAAATEAAPAAAELAPALSKEAFMAKSMPYSSPEFIAAQQGAEGASAYAKGMDNIGLQHLPSAAFGAAMQRPAQPVPLSSNVTEAKGVALQALRVGAPMAALRSQLATTYDSATVEFVLAALPNRLPQ